MRRRSVCDGGAARLGVRGLEELLAALAEQGLVDADGRWAAGNARLW
ncbi:serine/threonine protein phosphatase, partial [Streptomyces sp. FT05W]